jgi:hypothetical protein
MNILVMLLFNCHILHINYLFLIPSKIDVSYTDNMLLFHITLLQWHCAVLFGVIALEDLLVVIHDKLQKSLVLVSRLLQHVHNE